LGRLLLSHEKFFFQYLTAARGPGEVLLGPPHLGGVMDIPMDGSQSLMVRKAGFLAATWGIELKTTRQSVGKWLFSKEGLFVLKVTGSGVVFVSGISAIHVLDVPRARR
jgi:uncharacterized protein (AIM24 family)